MATLTVFRNNNSRVASLPAIEHPRARLSKGELEIHGSSRDGSLPPLRTEDNPLSCPKSKRHSRGSTWPIGQEKDSRDGQHFITLTHKKTVEELEELICEKLTTGFYGIRHAFKANDPQGKGTISKDAFKNILYHLCGYVSTAQFNALLQRFCVDVRSAIAFDDFIRHFKDNEVVQKEWIDPVLRPTNTAAHLPANKIRSLQRQAAAKRLNNPKQKKLYTALQVFPMLKRKVNENFLEFAKLFPTSCFEANGTVLKPQLRLTLHTMNIDMYDDEFDKVWDRLDRGGLGTVDCRVFFKLLGLRSVKDPPDSDVIEERLTPIPTQEAHTTEEINTTEVLPAAAAKSPFAPESIKEEEAKEDTFRLLQQKLHQGYESILHMFSVYDTDNSGTISRGCFRDVLSKCHLNLGPVEVEHFLSRFGVRDQVKVHYREILDALEDRTDKGLLHKIMDDKKHRFNRSRQSDVGNTSAVDAEAKLLDIIHSDFLALLAAFKQLDLESLGVIKKYHFQEMLCSRFGIELTKQQTADLLKKIGAETSDGLVDYGKFLHKFSSHREKSPTTKIPDRPTTTSPTQRPTTTPTKQRPITSPTRPATVQSGRPPTDIEPRDPDQLLVDIGNLVIDKYDVINKSFIGIDRTSRNCGHLTRETFKKLFDRHNLKMTTSEVNNLWKKLPVERDGTLNFIELVKTCFNEAGKTMPSDSEHQALGLSRVLQSFARAHIKDNLERFPEEDEENQMNDFVMETTLDEKPAEHCEINNNNTETVNMTSSKVEDIINNIKYEIRNHFTQIQDDFREARHENKNTIDVESFTNILQKHCKNVNSAECSKLCQRFDKGNTERIKYKEFLKVFVPTMPEGTDPIASRCHSRHDRAKTYPTGDRLSSDVPLTAVIHKIKNKMISDWKALRRAMKKCDSTDDGTISISDFKSTLKHFGFILSEEDLYHIFSAFDVNMDGRMSYVAFMKHAVV